ncbi:MAG: uroporphyrinogen decarboxylase family protein [Candidatus Brocadiia bacterium]
MKTDTDTLNREAMSIPAEGLVGALKERIERKRETLAERDRRFGADRVRISSYMENIGWPELFGYDMNRFFTDAEFALEQALRQRIFWLDNSLDDDLPGLQIPCEAGHYYDMTLFGLPVTHDRDGVPQFGHHPIADEPDLSVIEPFDFRRTGAMPRLLRHYEGMCEHAVTRYGGEVAITFPNFNRGPLDVCMQVRGYESFVADMHERPGFAHEFLELVADERARWRAERRSYLGLESPDRPRRIDDDWVNVPFITPGIFREFVAPIYARIQRNEGPIEGWHSCGDFTEVAADLLRALPDLKTLEVSGWTDLERLDSLARAELPFFVSFKNAFVLSGSEQRHRALLGRIARLAGRRPVSVCAQAIVKLHGSYAEDIGRMNRFIRRARKAFAC